MNNNLTNQENKTEDKNTPQFAWEKPVLYTEEWLNTLGGNNGLPEGGPPDNGVPS